MSQETSESLFDTNFTSEKEKPKDEDVLPSLDTQNEAIIGYRILVSIKEAGIIIGKEGSVIANIRDSTNVKAAISPVIPTCPDRILTITGSLNSVSQAIGLVAEALRNSPLDDSSFVTFPLKRLSVNNDPEVQSLRFLIPNAQMGTIIGKQGSRIKALQTEYDVKIIASKDFLYNSTERLVEIQGVPSKIENVLGVLSRCLLEDWHNGTGTSYYMPTPRSNSRNQSKFSGESITKKIKFPSEMVGCLIGKSGSRIQEIRKVTGIQILIDSKDDDNNERLFELIGPSKSVERALSYLNHNLEKEKERREKLSNE